MPGVPALLGAALLIIIGQAAPATWGDTLRDVGYVGGVLVVCWAFYTGRVHSDRAVREMLAERDRRIQEAEARADEWKEIATGKAIPLARSAVEAARSSGA